MDRSTLRLFPYVDDKQKANNLKIDKESVHYISVRETASAITSIISQYMRTNWFMVSDDIVMTDITAGVGGNVISFGKHFKKVNAIEINKDRYEYLKNNIEIYGLTNIQVYNNDCIDIMNNIEYHDIVFIDPPWGGKNYKKYKNLRLSLSSVPIEDICKKLFDKKNNICTPKLIALKLPTNYDVNFLLESLQDKQIIIRHIKKMLLVVVSEDHKIHIM